MENDNDMKLHEEDALGFLEKVEENSFGVKADHSLVSDAAKFNVNLKNIEKVGAVEAFDEIVQSRDNDAFENTKAHDLLENVDIRLNDVVSKVLKKSDRPFIIVRDDKIGYANKTFMSFVGIKKDSDIVDQVFFNFVAKDDWNVLAENIGEMLTSNKILPIRIKLSNKRYQKMNFEAIYLNDSDHFSFILVGERVINRFFGLYDEITGLPSFYLLEDRINVAINNENYKDYRLKKSQIALIGVCIDNMDELVKQGVGDLVLERISAKLLTAMKKNYTIASGLKYHFWVLIPDLESRELLDMEIAKVKEIMKEAITDGYANYDLVSSVGVSIYPDPAPSAKKILEQAVLALQKAMHEKDEDKKVVFFGN